MSILNSTEYYAAREQRERDLAEAASDPAIAAIHHDMAERYAVLQWPRYSVRENYAEQVERVGD